MDTGTHSAAGASSAPEDDPALIGAIRADDPGLVKRLLLEGADPAVRDTHGTPAFCLAVGMRSGTVAQLLLTYGADPGRCEGPPLPLREAVDSGSPALLEALLDDGGRDRYPVSEMAEATDLARHWHETGVERELRRRTGSQGAVARVRVQDDEFTCVDAYSLGGVTVRDGHAAILTRLEELLGVHAPFGELMGRALSRPEQDHSVWASATILLGNRGDQETWAPAAALRTHPDPVHRLFGAEVMRLTHLFDAGDEDAFAGPVLDMFVDWSAEETDSAVLGEILVGIGEHAGPRATEALLPHAGHHDERVRRAVAHGFSAWPSPPVFSAAVRQVLLELMRDPAPSVRWYACLTVADGRDREPALADAMAALLDDADRRVRLSAVYGLARHDDGRCVEAARRLGPHRAGHADEERYLDEVRLHEWRRREAEGVQ
ncbi:hypothetical protein [Streptomyces sp. NPDC001741]|uniref:hypothetical protein n=1 Tax=Streptomyces sp. NPDC001741 TaxID=3364605 RepID=UPI003681010A